jgi:hypothetical protein
MKELSERHEKILIYLFLIITFMTLSVTYYRYQVVGDFVYDTKPISEFTEDDL